MMEMAIVSIDRVRLEYRTQKGDASAIIIKSLLEKPALLFTTTLISVNLFLQVGSQAARLMFSALDLNPNYSAPLQILLTLIFAELTPLMIARQFSDTIALKGARALYMVKLLLTPILILMQKLTSLIETLLPKRSNALFGFTRGELEALMSEGSSSTSESLNLSTLMKNLTNLKNRSIEELMIPLKKIPLYPYTTDLESLRKALIKEYHPYCLIYMKQKHAIVGIVFSRDLLTFKNGTIEAVLQPAWFLTSSTPIKMLKLFRQNRQKMAVVLNKRGQARGLLTLDAMIAEILAHTHHEPHIIQEVLDRHFCPDTRIATLNQQYNLQLPEDRGQKLVHLFGAFQENPLRFGHIRLTKKESQIHIQTLNL
jgi:putative hemolysin